MKNRQQYRIEYESCVNARVAKVWENATDMKYVNKELFPIAYMTYPKERSKLSEHAATGKKIFRSWIFAFYVLPIDYYDITFEVFEKEKRFVEVSPLFSQKSWRHERRITEEKNGCVVHDTVQFTPKLSALGGLFYIIYNFTFYLRHSNLRKIYKWFGFASNDALELNGQSFIERTIASLIKVGAEHRGDVSFIERNFWAGQWRRGEADFFPLCHLLNAGASALVVRHWFFSSFLQAIRVCDY